MEMSTLNVRIFVLAVFILRDISTFQWTSDHSEGTVKYVCRGQDLLLPWNFTLSHGEHVAVIQWYFRGQSEELIAMISSHGVFIPMAAFANRVEFVPTAGIILKNVVPSDRGNYSVEITSEIGPNEFHPQRSTVFLDVTDPPSSDHNVMTATQGRSAVYNNHSDDYAVQLSCGHFTSLGHPPLDVVWTTPTGESKQSTSYNNGSFLLTLDNPVKGGNYSCSVVPSSPAAACLSGSSGLLRHADVIVDEVGARLTLIEARQEVEIARLQQQNQQLAATDTNLTSQIDSLTATDANLTSQIHSLTAIDANLTSQIHSLTAIDANLTSQIHSLTATDANLTSYIHTLEHNLTQHIQDFDYYFNNLMTGPCVNHTVLNDSWRDVNQGRSNSYCDSSLNLTTGWYRFLLNGHNAFIPTSCVQPSHCGTDAPVWLDLQGKPMPGLGQDETGTAYGSYTGGCKTFVGHSVTVRNCGTYFVYHLQPSSDCHLAFCATLSI